MDKYKKCEVDSYFFDKSLELDLKKAKEEGIKETQISMAKNMKNRNMDFNFISELTGLSIKEIEEL